MHRTGSHREQRDDARRVCEETIRQISDSSALGREHDLEEIWNEARNYWQSLSKALLGGRGGHSNMARTNPEKAYQAGFQDGYQLAKTEMQAETDRAIDRLNAKTAELDAEAQAVRAALARLRTLDCAVDTERGPRTWLN